MPNQYKVGRVLLSVTHSGMKHTRMQKRWEIMYRDDSYGDKTYGEVTYWDVTYGDVTNGDVKSLYSEENPSVSYK
jgi:hypothetical protein